MHYKLLFLFIIMTNLTVFNIRTTPAQAVPPAATNPAHTTQAADQKTQAAYFSILGTLQQHQNTTPKDAIIKISQSIQALKTIIQDIRKNAVQAAANWFTRRNNIKPILMETTPFPQELANLVTQYEPNCMDYDSLLLYTMKPFVKQIDKLSGESAQITAQIAMKTLVFDKNLPKAHSTLQEAELKQWESGGFHTPMETQRFKPNTLVCSTCKASVHYLSGDYSEQAGYMEPADYHNYSFKHPEAIQKLQSSALQTLRAIQDCSSIPDTNDPKFAQYILRRLNRTAELRHGAIRIAPRTDLDMAVFARHNLHSTYELLHTYAPVALYLNDPEGFKKLNLQTYQDIQDALASMSKEMSSK